jgi:phosphocarrier protein FPr
MIETPAAALGITSLASMADFFSLGTNDLVQYLLCAERGHPGLTEFQDGLHSAVLKTLRIVVADAQSVNRPISVCGELAADPEAVPLLLALGLRSLSVAPRLVTQTKAVVRALSLEKCRQAYEKLLASGAVRGPEVRQLVRAQFAELAVFEG